MSAPALTVASMRTLWSRYTAAPHRVMFLPGALQVVLVMAWWLFDLIARDATGMAPHHPLAAGVLHVWWMLYGVFPFFIFGFLMTAMPNWLNAPPPRKAHYVGAGLLLAGGVILIHAGLSAPGMALHLAGMLLGTWALWRVFAAARANDRTHARLILFILALSTLGAALFLVWRLGGAYETLAWAKALGLWGFLTPLYLTVCHRMLPWFTSRVVPGYVMVRPIPALWAWLALCLAHALCEAMDWSAARWLVDLPLAGLTLWFARRWRIFMGARQAWLLAMLHVAFLLAALAFVLYALESVALALGWREGLSQAPLHVLGIGFLAGMLVAMASRVSLGHSGRALEADRPTWGLFLTLMLAALTRALAEWATSLYTPLLFLSAALWLAAFGLWAWRYAPLYWRPRADGKAG